MVTTADGTLMSARWLASSSSMEAAEATRTISSLLRSAWIPALLLRVSELARILLLRTLLQCQLSQFQMLYQEMFPWLRRSLRAVPLLRRQLIKETAWCLLGARGVNAVLVAELGLRSGLEWSSDQLRREENLVRTTCGRGGVAMRHHRVSDLIFFCLVDSVVV